MELRRELDLGAHDPLDAWKLANHLGIETASISDLRSDGVSSETVHHLTRVEPGVFSAGTVFRETRAVIIYNESHARTRTANSIAHEISHVVLEHEPSRHFIYGCRRWDATQENEADWLAGCLLVPGEAALRIARLGVPIPEAAERFGISHDLMRMRLNVSGAYLRVRRARAGRKRNST